MIDARKLDKTGIPDQTQYGDPKKTITSSVLQSQKETRRTGPTWSPALEDRETGFFLSLSLFAAVVFAARSPFPPFPAILRSY